MILVKAESKGNRKLDNHGVVISDTRYGEEVTELIVTDHRGQVSKSVYLDPVLLDELSAKWLKYRGLIEDI